ncbi:Hypothetical_protein [Hexamita inflata]|uniref:Hypothetical_protein n=1 Tax=Hexamita inflata TaxID=28002 RepID=A0AA86QN73_9EUKA|nr:Hypothetical protein HINF_LOCUS44692 [Hexamita inflata]
MNQANKVREVSQVNNNIADQRYKATHVSSNMVNNRCLIYFRTDIDTQLQSISLKQSTEENMKQQSSENYYPHNYWNLSSTSVNIQLYMLFTSTIIQVFILNNNKMYTPKFRSLFEIYEQIHSETSSKQNQPSENDQRVCPDAQIHVQYNVLYSSQLRRASEKQIILSRSLFSYYSLIFIALKQMEMVFVKMPLLLHISRYLLLLRRVYCHSIL